ncbi:transposase domain-containing protein [Streptomyces sp. JHA26]|uniref:transposase domain-containing protein n=1 Tax=Streptomyces sp. JHA26 TaxID=1917143 RepID=UPI0015C53B46
MDQALVECGRRDRRPGALPSRFMIYYVPALALFHQDSYDDVAENAVGAWSASCRTRAACSVRRSIIAGRNVTPSVSRPRSASGMRSRTIQSPAHGGWCGPNRRRSFVHHCGPRSWCSPSRASAVSSRW